MDDVMPPIVAVEEPRPLVDVKALRFTASSWIEDSAMLLRVVTEQMLAWAEGHADEIAVLRVEYQYGDDAHRTVKRGAWALLTETTWTVSAVLYYEESPE